MPSVCVMCVYICACACEHVWYLSLYGLRYCTQNQVLCHGISLNLSLPALPLPPSLPISFSFLFLSPSLGGGCLITIISLRDQWESRKNSCRRGEMTVFRAQVSTLASDSLGLCFLIWNLKLSRSEVMLCCLSMIGLFHLLDPSRMSQMARFYFVFIYFYFLFFGVAVL